ncbi:avidin-like [Accipiter gentilis]|uniref:avidin-like n=1 Tax=Astur gentilis TaxID=8957 RepID=UPI002110CEB0|nr:avidin-like [Accipiter gentilis]XP_049652467.1 avidin-like [Accipiter gentilis]XP_049652468.1 avidin-like [Accipiter gentilis]
MVQVTPLLLILGMVLVAPGYSAKKCVLTGRWMNELGSNMTIMPVNGKGEFWGFYHTAVKTTTNEIQVSPLRGSQHRPNQQRHPTFGFTVKWSFSDSVTVFTGQCFVDEKGNEILKTMWLQRSHVDNIKDDWKATRVGTNVFTRLRPRQECSWEQGDSQASDDDDDSASCSFCSADCCSQ